MDANGIRPAAGTHRAALRAGDASAGVRIPGGAAKSRAGLDDLGDAIVSIEGLMVTKRAGSYPDAADPGRVGDYPAVAFAGGGLVWDEVLEYRVWCHDGEQDHYYAFATYEEALSCAEATPGADEPIALILQKEYVDEPAAGSYVHVKEPRVTEWPVELLRRPRRTEDTIPRFLAPDAPANRLDILRGDAPPPGKSQ